MEAVGEGDKLRDGPCAEPYLALEACAADKNVKSHRVSELGRVVYYSMQNKLAKLTICMLENLLAAVIFMNRRNCFAARGRLMS